MSPKHVPARRSRPSRSPASTRQRPAASSRRGTDRPADRYVANRAERPDRERPQRAARHDLDRPTRRDTERSDRSGDRTTSARPYRAKRVRAGSASSKARKKQAQMSTAQAAAREAPPPSAPDLSEKQRRHLRGLAHELRPIIRLGNAGLTDAVAAETARALHDHELIKVKGPGGDREARDTLFTELAQRTASTLVHRIGNIAVLYRPNATLPRILIPDAIT